MVAEDAWEVLTQSWAHEIGDPRARKHLLEELTEGYGSFEGRFENDFEQVGPFHQVPFPQFHVSLRYLETVPLAESSKRAIALTGASTPCPRVPSELYLTRSCGSLSFLAQKGHPNAYHIEEVALGSLPPGSALAPQHRSGREPRLSGFDRLDRSRQCATTRYGSKRTPDMCLRAICRAMPRPSCPAFAVHVTVQLAAVFLFNPTPLRRALFPRLGRGGNDIKIS